MPGLADEYLAGGDAPAPVASTTPLADEYLSQQPVAAPGTGPTADLSAQQAISLGEQEQGRTSATAALTSAITKSAYPTGIGDIPDMLNDPDVLEGYYEAYEQGFSGIPSPDELRKQGIEVPERSGLVSKVGAFLKRRVKSMGYGVLGGPFTLAGSGYVGEELHEMGVEEKTRRLFEALNAPPGGRTVRSPTALSTGLDVLATGERQTANLISPREGVGRLKGAALALIPPSWANVEPHDIQKLYRGHVESVGGNPDDIKHVVAGIGLSIFGDPTTYMSGIGIGKKAATFVGLRQAERVIRSGLKASGVVGRLGDEVARTAMDDIVAKTISAGSLDEARPIVAQVIEEHVGKAAAVDFLAYGDAWGDVGVRLGLPFTEGREVISAKAVHKVTGAVKKAAGKAEDAIPLLRKLHQAFDPIAEVGLDKGWEGGKLLYARVAAARDPIEHATRVSMDQYHQIARHLGKASPKQAAALLEQTTGEMAGFASDAEKVEAVARDWATSVLDMPHRAGRERFLDGTLRVSDEVTEHDDLFENVARRGYAHALVEGLADATVPTVPARAPAAAARKLSKVEFDKLSARLAKAFEDGDAEAAVSVFEEGGNHANSFAVRGLKRLESDYDNPAARAIAKAYDAASATPRPRGPDPTNALQGFHTYVKSALKQHGFADDSADTIATDLWVKVQSTFDADLGNYNTVLDSMTDRVDTLVRFYKKSTDEMLAVEQGRIDSFAKGAADRAAAAARKAGKNAGKAYNETLERINAKAAAEIDSYVHHFIQNTDAIRRRGVVGKMSQPSAAGKPAKHRTMLSIVDNYEAGQNPATDAMVSLAARQYAHLRMRYQWDVIDAATDERWMRPASSKLTKADGWDSWTHHITGEEFAVREGVRDVMEKSLDFAPDGPVARFYDSLLSRWKGYVTHGRGPYYNLRNLISDSWRMSMAGFSFAEPTIDATMKILSLGRLGGRGTFVQTTKALALARREGRGAVKQVVRGVRRPAKGALGKWYRGNLDALSDRYDDYLEAYARGDHGKIANKALGIEATPGEAYEMAAKHGIVDKGHVAMELSGDMPENTMHARVWDAGSRALKPLLPWSRDNPLLGQNGVLLRTTGRVARYSENWRRLALFLDRFQAGDTWEQAARVVKKWLFDYKELTKWEQKTFRRVSPFYTFSRNNIPRQWEAMVRNPRRFLYLEKTKRGVEEKAESEHGPIGVVSEYLNKLHAWRYDRTDEGSPLWFAIPTGAEDVNMTGPGFLEDRLTPMYDIFNILAFSVDPRTGRKLSGRMQEVDPVLEAIIVAGFAGNPPEWALSVVNEKGKDEVKAPAEMVALYKKVLGHSVAYGKLFAPDKVDLFEREQAKYRQRREGSGFGFYVDNPVRAERYRAREILEGNLAVPAATPQGTVRSKYDLGKRLGGE